ncbi:hypothetical protein D3C73_975170 [compost metagenome]
MFQPVAEGLTEAGGHAACADVRRQCQQQRHQRQAEGRQLLAAIGEKPLTEHRTAALQQQVQQRIEHDRQRQRGADQQDRHQHETTGKTIAKTPSEHCNHDGERRDHTLATQPAGMGLMPGLRIGQCQQRQARRTQQTAGTGQQGAEKAQANTAEPPPWAQAQLTGHLGAIQPAQAGCDVG